MELIIYYLESALAIFKAFMLVVSLLSIFGIIVVIVKSSSHRKQNATILYEELEPRIYHNISSDIRSRKLAKEGWNNILMHLNKEKTKDYKRAIIEADALADTVLKIYGYPGASMGERMKSIRSHELPSLNSFWEAHKVRNDAAHNSHYSISSKEGERIMLLYGKVLEELGAI